jgi:uncharacterized protein (TIRG00374 family)
MKRWQTLVIGLVVSAATLALALSQVDLAGMAVAFRTARYGYVVLAFVGLAVTILLRGWRWSILTAGRLAVGDAFWLFSIGFLFNNVLPARLGEFARAFLAGRRPDMQFSSALSSIVVERLFDMISVVALLVLSLIMLPLPQWALTAGAVMGSGALIGIAILAAAARWPEHTLRISSRVLAVLPGVDTEGARSFVTPFITGLAGVSNPRIFSAGLATSLLAWLASGFTGWLLMLAFWPSMPLIAGQLVIAAAGLGVSIPAAPSGVGPFEAAVIGVLGVMGYDLATSSSFAFALHAVNFIVTSVFGLLGLLREGMSFGEVAAQARALSQGNQKEEAA